MQHRPIEGVAEGRDPLKDAPLADRLTRLVEMIRAEGDGGQGELAVTLTLSAIAGWINDALERHEARRLAQYPAGSPERAGWHVSRESTAHAAALARMEKDARNSLLFSAMHGEIDRFVRRSQEERSRRRSQ